MLKSHMPKIILKTTLKETGRRQSIHNRISCYDVYMSSYVHPGGHYASIDVKPFTCLKVYTCVTCILVYLRVLILEVQHIKTACESMYSFLRLHLPNTHHCDRFVWSLAPTLGK